MDCVTTFGNYRELQQLFKDSRVHQIEFMGLVTYKRSIGSRHPYKPVPARPGLHCLGWPVSVAHDMSRSLPATSCTGGVRRRSRYLALTFFPCTRCAFL